MRTIAVTGSASGIGAAVRGALAGAGDRVIGIDLRDADVEADLSHAAGRAKAVAAVERACGATLGGVVACAGLGPQVPDPATIVSVNYFGAAELLAALRPALARSPRSAAVAVASNSAGLVASSPNPLTEACLRGDEAQAREIAAQGDGFGAYAGSKLALARFVRRCAVSADWAGAGIRLNAVAPGAVRTPLLDAGLAHDQLGPAIRAFPIPLGAFGEPQQIAAVIAFLLSEAASFCCGSIVFVDGGSDALTRPDSV